MEGFFVKGTRRFHFSSHICGQVTLHKTGRCVQLYPNTLHGTNRNIKGITLLNLGKYCTMFHAKPSSLTVADFEYVFMHHSYIWQHFAMCTFSLATSPYFSTCLLLCNCCKCAITEAVTCDCGLHHGTLFICPTYT